MGKWWMPWRVPPPAHDARLDQSGGWPGATVGINSAAMQPWQPSKAPQGWYAANVPVSGDWIPIPVYYLQSGRTIQARHLQQIGPYDESANQAAALQAALAATLKGIQGGQ